jgi:hypothetical protein
VHIHLSPREWGLEAAWCALRSIRPRPSQAVIAQFPKAKNQTRLIEFQMAALFQRTKDERTHKKAASFLFGPADLNRLIYARRRPPQLVPRHAAVKYYSEDARRRHKVIQFARTNWIRRKKPLVSQQPRRALDLLPQAFFTRIRCLKRGREFMQIGFQGRAFCALPLWPGFRSRVKWRLETCI